MKALMGYLGLFVFITGVGSADSENLLIPLFLVILGMIIFKQGTKE